MSEGVRIKTKEGKTFDVSIKVERHSFAPIHYSDIYMDIAAKLRTGAKRGTIRDPAGNTGTWQLRERT